MRRYLVGWMCVGAVAIALGCNDTSSEPAPPSAGASESVPPRTSRSSRPVKVVAKDWVYKVLKVAASACQWTLESVHDGTGWLLGKAEVSIDQDGELRQSGEGEFVADFIIKVKAGDETFSVTVKDVPCSEMAIPSDGSQEKFNTAVREIKAMLANLQG